MGLKQLGILKEIVEAVGMSISYVYDDLVFIDHNAFLLRFADNDREVFIHVNRAADKKELGASIAGLRSAASARCMLLLDGCSYTLEQEGDEQIRLEFVEC